MKEARELSPVNETQSPIERLISRYNFPKGRERWITQELGRGLLRVEDLSDPRRIEQMQDDQPVAYHEAAHAAIVQATGGTVYQQCVIPEGGVRGYVRYSPNPTLSLESRLANLINICVAGMVGEEMFGNNAHEGCGSDFSCARYYALLLRKVCGIPDSVDSIINRGITRTRSLLYSIGTRGLKQSADRLTRLRFI